MIDPTQLQYPPPLVFEDEGTGLFPVDFLLEDVIKFGLNWFKTDANAPNQVFSHLTTSWLKTKYGQKKIDEIANYLRKYEVKVVQHFSLIDQTLPTVSIQLMDGGEMTERAGLNDHVEEVTALNMESEMERREIKYSPVNDSIQIGIHAAETPDLCKYLYYLVIYILLLFKPELERRGLQLSTFRATDISRLNEFLPQNVYSRFINFSVFTIAKVDAGQTPLVDQFLGVHAHPSETVGIGVSVEGLNEDE